ncbi:MAG: NfeD family protein [Candidatus Heimdallarchaeota archaeon]|nr:NfeD family protein [Candidatus Heimdallarchaeota archaeon]
MFTDKIISDSLRVASSLLVWEEWLKGFCIGFLIFGCLVVALVLVTMGISAGHSLGHDIDHDIDISADQDISVDKDFTIDKDITFDKDLTIDKDFSIDKDISVETDINLENGFTIDKDINVDKDIAVHPQLHFQIPDQLRGPIKVEKGTSAPLLLLMAVFSITFGGLGLLLFWQEPDMNAYIRLTVILVSPIVLSTIVNLIWRKVAISETYRLPTNSDFIGREAVVIVDVDSKGGTIRVEIPGQFEPLKVPAKTVYKHQEFFPDELVFVVGVERNFYLVDDSRDLLTGKVRKALDDSNTNSKNEE